MTKCDYLCGGSHLAGDPSAFKLRSEEGAKDDELDDDADHDDGGRDCEKEKKKK